MACFILSKPSARVSPGSRPERASKPAGCIAAAPTRKEARDAEF
jgi:hypothetical protein